MREADLYPALKSYLEGQGYAVKAEIGACDVLARRGEEPPLVVEMKLSFSLALVLQGVARQALFEHVYLAVPVSGEKGWKLRYREIVTLCRRLGLGLLAVRAEGGVEAHLDPGPYQPRRNAAKAGRLLREFDRRVGDPNQGGAAAVKKVTHYRQDALRCLAVLAGGVLAGGVLAAGAPAGGAPAAGAPAAGAPAAGAPACGALTCGALAGGALRAAVVARASGVTRAATLLRANHYGWFERVSRGTYMLTPKGRQALVAEAPGLLALGLAPLVPGPAPL